MPMRNKVSKPETDGQSSVRDNESSDPSLATLLFVQEGRTAATKGLLHDFSNVMVGLCSLSENALDEAETGTPLHDDMEIIRDSAVRAHLLIRRIVALNSTEVSEPSLVDLVTWLHNEIETIRATLPKGSDVMMPNEGKSMLVSVRESRLRDFILMLTADISNRQKQSRISMNMSLSEKGRDNVLLIRFSDAHRALEIPAINKDRTLYASILSEMALGLDAACTVDITDDGSFVVELTLHGA